jgi:hypothetical protein
VANCQIVHKFSSTGYIDSVSVSPDGAMIAAGADSLFGVFKQNKLLKLDGSPNNRWAPVLE